MSKAPFAGQQKPHHTAFAKRMQAMSGRHQLWRLFADFCELAALSLSNVVAKNPDREKRYLDIVGRYEPDEQKAFPELLSIVVAGLEAESDVPTCDFLGECFMAMELSSHWHGQFFTPWNLALMMATMVAPDAGEEIIRTRGYVKVLEPAAGAGVMILGLAAAMRARGLNPQTQLHVTAVDVDPTAAHMTFIQLALWHIPAVVVIGNTLTLEEREHFHTPAHWLGMWDLRLRVDRVADVVQTLAEAPQSDPAASADVTGVPAPDVQENAVERATDPSIPAPRPQMKLF